MRVGARDRGAHEHRARAGTHLRDRRAHHVVAGEEIGAVDFHHGEVRERRRRGGRCCRPASARRPGPRSRSRCPRRDKHRQPLRAGRVQRLPELAFAGGAVADRDVGDLVWMEALLASGNLRDVTVEQRRFGAADRLQGLRAGRAALRDDVEAPAAPVRGHLASAGGGIVLRTRPPAAACRAA